MWPFKKKEVKVLRKAKQRIAFSQKLIPIGKTTIEFTMEDGRTFNSIFYGKYKQKYEHGNIRDGYVCPLEPRLVSVEIVDSLKEAQSILKELSNISQTFRDDYYNTINVMIGKAVAARIVKTEEYEKMFDVAYLEENK